MTFTNLINYFYKNEKDLGLQKFPRHISIDNVHYLPIKCNTFLRNLKKFLILYLIIVCRYINVFPKLS